MACSCATAEVRRLLGDSFARVESPSLRLEKLLRIGDRSRPDEIDAVVKCHNRHADASHAFRPVRARTLKMKLGGRLIVNQAGGVIENAGLCLHRHFGFATIPGSAVKGVARHTAWCRWRDCDDEAERRELARRIAVTFGFPTGDRNGLDAYLMEDCGWTTRRAGAVSFLPAVPSAAATLVTDIVTCHHREYYEGKRTVATDDEAPNPQVFPAVEAGTSFTFSLLPTRRARHCDFDVLGFAEECLTEALEDWGAGAKTAAGYGWFSFDQEGTERERREQERLAKEAEEAERLEALSPDDRFVEELGAKGREAFIADHINPIETKDDAEQRLILRALLEKYRDIWDADKKAKPKKKAGQRAAKVRSVAEKLGVALP